MRLEHKRVSPLVSPVGVTLISTYDMSRLHMLDGLCSSWGGHISAAVYQVTGANVECIPRRQMQTGSA